MFMSCLGCLEMFERVCARGERRRCVGRKAEAKSVEATNTQTGVITGEMQQTRKDEGASSDKEPFQLKTLIIMS